MKLFRILKGMSRKFGVTIDIQKNDKEEDSFTVQVRPSIHNQGKFVGLNITATAEELDENFEKIIKDELLKSQESFKLDGSLQMEATAKPASPATTPAKKPVAKTTPKPKPKPKPKSDPKPKVEAVDWSTMDDDDDWD